VFEGQRLADLHHCTSCHRPALTGQEQAARLPGQDFDYLLRLLRGFKAKTACDLDGTMTTATQPLTDTRHRDRQPRPLHHNPRS
jgi:cytochrome c553